jgi:hypothetical protein
VHRHDDREQAAGPVAAQQAGDGNVGGVVHVFGGFRPKGLLGLGYIIGRIWLSKTRRT